MSLPEQKWDLHIGFRYVLLARFARPGSLSWDFRFLDETAEARLLGQAWLIVMLLETWNGVLTEVIRACDEAQGVKNSPGACRRFHVCLEC